MSLRGVARGAFSRIKWVFSPLGSSDLSVEQRGTLVRESHSACVETSGLTIAKPSYLYLTAAEIEDILGRNAYQLLSRLGKTFPAA